MSHDIKSHPNSLVLKVLKVINTKLFKQININQMFDKIEMILMMKMSILNNHMSLLN